MNLIQKSVLLSASALLFALPDVCAISESEAVPEDTKIQNDKSFLSDIDLGYDGDGGEWRLFMGMEIFSVSPTKDMVYGTSADMVGLNLKLGGSRLLSEELSYDLYCLCGYSNGKGEYSYRGKDDEYDVYLAEISFGMNIRWHVNDCFSVYAGGRIGGSEFYVKQEAGFGLAYGLGAGLEWAFNEHHAITFGYTFFGNTAEVENTFVNESLSVGQQSFSAFSLGYKYTY